MAKKTERKSKNNPSALIYKIAMIFMIIVFSIAILHQYYIRVGLKQEINQAISEVSKEKAIGNSLKNRQDNQDSPEFIEKIAREKLNMVRPNEIVFIDKNKKK